MEKTNRIIPLIYGYIVCLISIIVALIAVSMIVNALFSLKDPLRTNSFSFNGPTANLSSFEAFKLDTLNGVSFPGAPQVSTDQKNDARYTPTETELRTIYEASRNERIATVRLDSSRSITNGLILLILAAVLFFIHWRWLNNKVNQ